MDNTILSIQNLEKRFADNVVLAGINLDIPNKSIVTIFGRSGIGKSVLIKSIIGILQADYGKILYHGTDISRKTTKNRYLFNDFSYLFQESALFDSMNVFDNVAFPLREALHIKDTQRVKRRVTELLDWVELPNTEHLMPSELSGGMKKRVGFARTLAMNPKIMLCDEPTTGLDPITGVTIMNLIQRANQEFGVTCIIISHNIPTAAKISDKMAFLDDGIIQAYEEYEEFLSHPYPLLKSFINNSFAKKECA